MLVPLSKVTVRYYSSEMALNIDIDAAYLVFPNAKSRIAGCFYLSSDPLSTTPPINTPILVTCEILRHVFSSAAE